MLHLLYFVTLGYCLLHLIKELFPQIISKNSDLDDSGIYLPAFSSRTHLKLQNISSLVKKVITNLSSKISGPDLYSSGDSEEL